MGLTTAAIATPVYLAILFPLLGALYCACLGDALNRRLCGTVAAAAVGLAFICVLWATFQFNSTFYYATGAFHGGAGSPVPAAVEHTLYRWIVAGGTTTGFGILFDALSATMALVITGVGCLIHIYATSYMLEDMKGYRRFFCYMNLFIVAMLILVLANNFLMLMLGWGGVGLASYLLIAFYFDDYKSDGRPWPADELPPKKAGMKAFVTNMIGDVGLMLAVALMFARFGTVNYDGVFRATATAGDLSLLAFLLLLAAIAKSGQVPLHVWLPDAMTGPTPVSALIHAATMVTAGVYLIARAHPIFLHAPAIMGLVAIIGAVTAIFAATIALVQPNLKRVLAYSTVSQLGYMFLAVGVGAFTAGIFHLVTHAFFKAALFLAAGSVIHALHGEEDMEKMGGLRQSMPATYWAFAAGALALAGIFPFAGFWSKDEILAAALQPGGPILLGVIGLIVACLTGFYTFRAFIKTFHGAPRWPEGSHPHEAPQTMALPVSILAVLSLVGGFLNAGTNWLEEYFAPVFTRYGAEHAPGHENATLIAAISLALALGGIAVAYLFYIRQPDTPVNLARSQGALYNLLRNRYFIDQIYSAVLVAPLGLLARFWAEAVDRLTIDGAVEGIGSGIRNLSSALRPIQSGFARSYALAILAGAVVIIAYAVLLARG